MFTPCGLIYLCLSDDFLNMSYIFWCSARTPFPYIQHSSECFRCISGSLPTHLMFFLDVINNTSKFGSQFLPTLFWMTMSYFPLHLTFFWTSLIYFQVSLTIPSNYFMDGNDLFYFISNGFPEALNVFLSLVNISIQYFYGCLRVCCPLCPRIFMDNYSWISKLVSFNPMFSWMSLTYFWGLGFLSHSILSWMSMNMLPFHPMFFWMSLMFS